MPSTATNVLPALDIGTGVEIATQGSAAINAFGVLVATGSFSVELGTVTEQGKLYQAMALHLGGMRSTARCRCRSSSAPAAR